MERGNGLNATVEAAAVGVASTAVALMILLMCEAVGLGPFLLRLGGG